MLRWVVLFEISSLSRLSDCSGYSGFGLAMFIDGIAKSCP